MTTKHKAPLQRILPFIFLFALGLLTPDSVSASPATATGEVGESVARVVLGGKSAVVVPTARGRHGLDFVYYDKVDGKTRLFVSEVKTGQAMQRQNLALSANEQRLLKQHGIAPERLPNGSYRIQQGSHAYNLVQMDRLAQRNANFSTYTKTLKQGGKVSRQQTRAFARHVDSLGLNLNEIEKRQLKIISRTGNPQDMQTFMAKHGAEIRRGHQAEATLMNRAFKDVGKGKYTSQLVRLNVKDGRYALRATALDASGKPLLAGANRPLTRELTNVNWKNYRESGPIRAIIKEQASTLCKGKGQQCFQTAYRSAIRELESGKEVHTAMRTMDAAAKTPQTAGLSSSRKTPSLGSPAKPSSQSARAAATLQARKAPNVTRSTASIKRAGFLRKSTLLRRVGKLMGAGLAPIAGAKGTAIAGAIFGSGKVLAVAQVALPVAAAIGGAILFDMYLDDKIQSHTDRLQEYMGQEFSALQTNIQNDLQFLGADIEYRFALTMEALERNAQGLTQLAEMMGDFETRMGNAFADLNSIIFDMSTRLDYSIVLTEAMLNDEFHAGLKFYDLYLETGEVSQLHRAEQSFTMAQARYEEVMLRVKDQEQAQSYVMLFALSSYYRAITYAEMARTQPEYAAAAINTFTGLVEAVRQSQEPQMMKKALPVINYTFASIEDLDTEGIAAEALLETYVDLIGGELAANQHISAQGQAMMLTLAMPENDTATNISELVNYVIGETSLPAEDLWEVETPLHMYVDYRENPAPGTVFALLRCAEDMEEGLALPSSCQLPTAELLQAAEKYQNEAVRKFAIRSLLRRGNVRDAQHILNRCYISDEVFRYKSMLVIDYFLNQTAFCEKARYIADNATFTDELRDFAKEKLRVQGKRCPSGGADRVSD